MTNCSTSIDAVLALSLRSAVIDPSTNEASPGNETYRLPHDSGVRKHLPDRVQDFSNRFLQLFAQGYNFTGSPTGFAFFNNQLGGEFCCQVANLIGLESVVSAEI